MLKCPNYFIHSAPELSMIKKKKESAHSFVIKILEVIVKYFTL